MLTAKELQGCFTALITPMKRGDGLKNEIDYKKLIELVDDQITAGIDGVVPCGTTGQSATLSHDEHVKIALSVYHQVLDSPTNIIIGAGSNCTWESLEMMQEIEKITNAPQTFLCVTGYYNNPTQRGIIRHFTKLADNIHGNIIMYNVPSRTSSNIEATTTIELSKHPKIIGIKEASGKLEHIIKIIEHTNPNKFRVLSGNCDQVYEIMKEGGYGVISATANIAPELFVELTKAAFENRWDSAATLQGRLKPIIDAVFKVKNPIPLAYMFKTNLRLPLTSLQQDKRKDVMELIDKTLEIYSDIELGIDYKKYKRM